MSLDILHRTANINHPCRLVPSSVVERTELDQPSPDQRALHDRWLIDNILPEGEMNLLAGPAGVGKTTLALQLGTDIQNGTDVWGRRTWATGMVIVSLDRSANAHERMLSGMSIPRDRFAFFSQRNSPTTIEIIVNSCASRFPQHGLIFIDGFATLCDGINSYSQSSAFLRVTGELCERTNRSILGSVHSTKTKEGEGYSNPRQRVLGSVAWAAYSDLIVTMDPSKPDDPSDMIRIVNILPRNSKEFTLKYERQGPLLVPWTDPVEDDLLSILDFWLHSQDFDREIPRREIVKYARENSIVERSVERWLDSKLELCQLERTRKGFYKRLRAVGIWA